MIVARIDVGMERLRMPVEANPWDEGRDLGEDRKFSNDRPQSRSLRKWLRKRGVTRVVLDPTGHFQLRSRSRFHRIRVGSVLSSSSSDDRESGYLW